MSEVAPFARAEKIAEVGVSAVKISRAPVEEARGYIPGLPAEVVLEALAVARTEREGITERVAQGFAGNPVAVRALLRKGAARRRRSVGRRRLSPASRAVRWAGTNSGTAVPERLFLGGLL
jgi:hypothetical protein